MMKLQAMNVKGILGKQTISSSFATLQFSPTYLPTQMWINALSRKPLLKLIPTSADIQKTLGRYIQPQFNIMVIKSRNTYYFGNYGLTAHLQYNYVIFTTILFRIIWVIVMKKALGKQLLIFVLSFCFDYKIPTVSFRKISETQNISNFEIKHPK